MRKEIRRAILPDPNAWHNVPQQIIRALPYVPDTYEYEGKTYNVSNSDGFLSGGSGGIYQ